MASYLFIDGAYFTEWATALSLRLWNTPHPPIDYAKLGYGYTKVFFYDCPPPEKDKDLPDYAARLSEYEKRSVAMLELHGWHVFNGTTKRSKKRGATQKEVDVQIAVDLMSHTFRKNMERATLIAGDQDFRPLVEAVVREGMFLTLWFTPDSYSEELRIAADARQRLTPQVLYSIAESAFQNSNPLPQETGVTGPDPSMPVLYEVQAADGRVFDVRSRNGQAVVIAQAPGPSGYYTRYECSDFDSMKRYLTVVEGIAWP